MLLQRRLLRRRPSHGALGLRRQRRQRLVLLADGLRQLLQPALRLHLLPTAPLLHRLELALGSNLALGQHPLRRRSVVLGDLSALRR